MTDEEFKDQLLQTFKELPELTTAEMFGGYAIYCSDKFFCIVYEGRFYFRVTEVSRQQYIERGSGPFQPTPRVKLTTYYEVPKEVADDPIEVMDWARKSISAIAAPPKPQ